MQLVELMQIAVQEKASDIHLSVGRPPMLRVHGELVPISDKPVLSAVLIQELVTPIIDENRLKILTRGWPSGFFLWCPKPGTFSG